MRFKFSMLALAALALAGCGGKTDDPLPPAPDTATEDLGAPGDDADTVAPPEDNGAPDNGVEDTTVEPDACTPQCDGKVCGDDGCGGSCGTCDAGKNCTAAGQCTACVPKCDGKSCGENGCGGTCGTCPEGQTCGDDGKCTGGDATCTNVPDAELLVKIIGPQQSQNGHRHAAVVNGTTPIGGIVYGNPDTLTWKASGPDGDTEGEISLADKPFWKTAGITLVQGDPTTITVTATKGDKTAKDVLILTYNPGFLFDADPTVSPDMAWVNEGTKLVINVPMTLYKFDTGKPVQAFQCDEFGKVATTSPLATLVDNGDLSKCDEIQKDGVYSACVSSFKCTSAQDVWIKVGATVSTADSSYTAWSAPVRIECAEHITVADCNADFAVHKDARDQWEAAHPETDAKVARDAAITWLKQQDRVEDAGPSSGDGYGVWVKYKSGILGALSLAPEGFRGGPGATAMAALSGLETEQTFLNTATINSKRALVLAPYAAEFTMTGSDEADNISSLLQGSTCPTFSVDGPLKNAKADLSEFRSQYQYGVIAVTTHGDAYFAGLAAEASAEYDWDHRGAQEVMWTGEAVACNQLTTNSGTCSNDGGCPPGTECVITGAQGTQLAGVCADRTQMDLRRGRVIMGEKNWGVAAPFVSRYAKRPFPHSFVYLGGCRTLYNGTLSAEYFASGASAVAGYGGYVHSEFAAKAGAQLFSEMVENKELTGGALFNTDIEDPQTPNACMRLFGATNLDIMNADILNPSFETSDLTGWTKDGDGRVISQLGISIPVHGKFMGVISTGLGFTVQTGEISQNFCIPGDKSEMQFYWKFFSEEFKEWCGSQFQDTFQATLTKSDMSGQITLVNAKVDDLCYYTDGSCPPCPDPGIGNCGCGGQYVGLIAADVSFDQGGVYNIQWQLAKKDITGLAGQGPVELKFFATDQGDSIYDTVILIDALVFK